MLTSTLQDLVTTAELCTLTEGLMEISAEQLSELKGIWTTWLRLAQCKGSWVEKLRQKAVSRDLDREHGLATYKHAIPKEHRHSAQQFFDTGIFTSTKNYEELTRQNPTLTGRGYEWFSEIPEFHYSIPMYVFPFTGWDYKAVKKFCHADSLPEMFSTYISQILHKVLKN